MSFDPVVKQHMLRKRLIILGGLSTIIWGITHVITTRLVVQEFSNVSIDNIKITAIEWIVEGITLIFLGALVIAVAVIDNQSKPVAKVVYFLSFLLLFAMAVISPFTRFW